MEDAADAVPRDEVKRRLVRVCRRLQTLARGSYGPLGGAQLLQANAQCPDALTATSVAERYFANVDVGDCPIANAYLHMLKSKIREHADGGLLLAGLSASVQLEVQEGRIAQIPHRIVRKGLQLALDWSLGYLDDADCPIRAAVSWSSVNSLYAVIRGIVSPKSIIDVDEATMELVLIPLILQAFISVFPYIVEFPNERVPVQLLFASGQKSIAKSQVWKQTVLLDLPWPHRGGSKSGKRGPLSPPLCNLRVALFNVTIEPLADQDEVDKNDTLIHHTGSLREFRLKALRQVGDKLERLGATAVLSQKIIPKYLQVYLAAKGIFSLDRLSLTYIRGVQMLSGATVISDWRLDDSVVGESLGFLSLITTQSLGNKQYIRLHRDASATMSSSKAHPTTTVALAASDRFAYDELCHAITTCFKTLARLMDNPQVVAGAGCAEIHVAAMLRYHASQLRIPATADATTHDKQTARTLRQLRQTVTTFAECLENIAGQLCGSQATAPERAAMIDQLRNANRESLLATATFSDRQHKNTLYGWDPHKRSAVSVLSSSSEEINDARILDSLQAKKDALVLAVESVCSLLGIAAVVRVP